MISELILIVEDDLKIAQVIADYLENDGFETLIHPRGDGAVELVRDEQPALVILDLMLPGLDGLSVCRKLRAFSNVGVLMLTARVDEIDRLIGLEVGADDYLCKPISPREVVARVRAILRRVSPAQLPSEERLHGAIMVRPDRFDCLVAGEPVELTPVEFRMLLAFMDHAGRVLPRERLIALSYGDGRTVSHRTIDTHVKNLRKKLGETTVIQSIYGMGYKLE